MACKLTLFHRQWLQALAALFTRLPVPVGDAVDSAILLMKPNPEARKGGRTDQRWAANVVEMASRR
jgi:hypothetical protein